MPSRLEPADPCTFVIFGASGDLTRRLLIPSLYNLAEEGLLPDRFAVIGFARAESTPEEFRARFKEAVAEVEGEPPEQAPFERVMQHFEYLQADFDDESGWQRLGEALTKAGRPDEAADAYLTGIDQSLKHGHTGMADDLQAAIEAL